MKKFKYRLKAFPMYSVEVIAKKFPKLGKSLDIQIQEADSKHGHKRNYHHTTIKLLKIQNEGRSSKSLIKVCPSD